MLALSKAQKMDDVKPAVGVLHVVYKLDGHSLDETITTWDEASKPYTFDIKNGKELLFTLTVLDGDDANTISKLLCVVDIEMTTCVSCLLPKKFLLKKKVGGVQMEIIEG